MTMASSGWAAWAKGKRDLLILSVDLVSLSCLPGPR